MHLSKEILDASRTSRGTNLLPEVDVENFSGKVKVNVGVVGVVPSVGDGQVQRDVLHSSEGQMWFAVQPDGNMM